MRGQHFWMTGRITLYRKRATVARWFLQAILSVAVRERNVLLMRGNPSAERFWLSPVMAGWTQWKRLARGQCENYRIVAPDGCSESHCMGFEPSGIRDGHQIIQIFIRTPDLDGKLKGLRSPQEMRMSESLGSAWAPWGQRPLRDIGSWVLWWKAQQLHWFFWVLWIAESSTVCRNLFGITYKPILGGLHTFNNCRQAVKVRETLEKTCKATDCIINLCSLLILGRFYS